MRGFRTFLRSNMLSNITYKIFLILPYKTVYFVGYLTFFDWTDEKTYDQVLAGVEHVYLIAPVGVADPSPLMIAFLKRALEMGVQRIVLQSASCISVDDPGLGAVHKAVQMLAPEWAVLRPSWFMQNFTDIRSHPHAISLKNEHKLVGPASGRVGFVDAEDIAEVATHTLIDEHAYNNELIITGPQALSYADVAKIITATVKHPIHFVGMQAGGLRNNYRRFGYDLAFATVLSELEGTWILHGHEDRVTPTVKDVTGHPPRSFVDFAAASSSIWQE